MIMMIDSDKPAPESPLAAVKTRLEEELRHNGGLPWITAGREVENYLPIEVFTDAAQKIHSHSTVDGGPSEGPFEDLAKRVSTNLSKVPVALAAVESSEGKMWDVLDLRTRMAEVVTYIRVSNEGG